MVEGVALVGHIGWDAFNENQDLIDQVGSYKQRIGSYPESALADGIYGTRDNRSYLKGHGIRFGGKALGRPPKVTGENHERLQQEKRQRRLDALDRIPIEGKFGQGKNGYRLNYIRARLQRTSEAWVRSIFLVMKLMVLLRELSEELFSFAKNELFIILQAFNTRCDTVFADQFKFVRLKMILS